MDYKIENQPAPNRERVAVLGDTFEAGKPECDELGRWRQKLTSRAEKLSYLKNGERYFYGKDWYGSEKRQAPA